MQITVTTRHGQLSDTSKERIEAKVDKLNRFFERLTSIAVIVDLRDADNPRVDLNVSAEHKHDFVGHDQCGSLMASVDSAVQKVEQQLKKYKQRVVERHRDPNARRVEAPIEPEPPE